MRLLAVLRVMIPSLAAFCAVFACGGSIAPGPAQVEDGGPDLDSEHSKASLRAISTSIFHSCGLLDDGSLVTWGMDVEVTGPDASDVFITPRPVSGIGDIAQVAAGGIFTCVLRTASDTRCWGTNRFGSVGNGETGRVVEAAVPVSGLPDAIQIAAGVYHACAVAKDRTVWCWGDDEYGQLGDGRSGDGALSALPVPVPGVRDAVQVTASEMTTCAVLADGTVWCWGGMRGAAAPVAGVNQATAVVVGATYPFFACARLRDATVTCWGDNEAGELGRGSAGGKGLPPGAAPGLRDVVSIAAGVDTACAVLSSGELRCWGNNSYGQVGNGTVGYAVPSPVPSPVRVVGLGPVVQVTAGDLITCALTADKHVWCWGNDQRGELGTTKPLGPIGTPVQIL